MRRVYLDHAATTPLDPTVAEVYTRHATGVFGNASSLHQWGAAAHNALEEAREQVAALIGAHAREIIFTSGGTESDNLAIRGTAYQWRNRGRHIITSAIEHHAVLHTCQDLEQEGFEVTYLPVDREGFVDPEDVRKAIRPDTILITIMMANNEIGTIEPVAEIAALARAAGITFHTDAVQAVGKIPVDVEELGIDLLSMSAHKLYGPKGVGALYIRQGMRIAPILFGGAHERGLRPGTQNVPGAAAFAAAAAIAAGRLVDDARTQAALRDRLLDGIVSTIPDTELTGRRYDRLPNHASVLIEGVDGSALLAGLDMAGIAASAGSACTAGAVEPSHVLAAMGLVREGDFAALRLTLGRSTTMEDIDYVLDVLPGLVERLRRHTRS